MWPPLLFADWWVPLLAMTLHFSVLGTRINEILDVSTSKRTLSLIEWEMLKKNISYQKGYNFLYPYAGRTGRISLLCQVRKVHFLLVIWWTWWWGLDNLTPYIELQSSYKMGTFPKKVKVKIRTEAVSIYFKTYSHLLLERLKKPM
jgi:hypothetical protein